MVSRNNTATIEKKITLNFITPEFIKCKLGKDGKSRLNIRLENY